MRLAALGRPAFVLLALCCATAVARAQGWEVGAMAGVSHADVIGSQEFDWAGRTPTSAALVRHGLWRTFAFQAEVAHLRRSGVSNVASSTLTMSADYVELPLMLQLRSPSFSVVTPYVAGGPGLSYRLVCRVGFLGGGLRTNDDCDDVRGAKSNRFDIGAVGGAGLGVRIGAATLGFEARTTFGLRTNVLPIDVQSARSFSWSVLAGVSVPLSARRLLPPVRMPTLSALPAPLEIIGAPRVEAEAPTQAALETSREARHVTIKAVDADVRRLITGIAETAGLNVVVSSDVNARVSVTLTDVPAQDAIKAITQVAGLTILPSADPTAATVVFYHAPVNVNEASADTIARRFDVSSELAKWVVETRRPNSKTP